MPRPARFSSRLLAWYRRAARDLATEAEGFADRPRLVPASRWAFERAWAASPPPEGASGA